MKDLPHAEMIANLAIFRGLSPKGKEKVVQTSKISTFSKDSRIYKSGDLIQYVYFVIEGKVILGRKTSEDKVIIKDLVYSDKLFGENVFTKANVRSEYATAMVESQILMIPIAMFQNLFMEHHAFAHEITKIIVERLDNIEVRIKNFVFMKAKQRIAGFIKQTANTQGIKIGMEEVLINHGMSHKEIAFVTDTSRQTVARVLGDLKRDNIIHFSERKPNKILIRDIAKLA